MTDFRHVCDLRAYSGGTVPDFDRIHYSPPGLIRYRRHSDVFFIISILAQTPFVKRKIFLSNMLDKVRKAG